MSLVESHLLSSTAGEIRVESWLFLLAEDAAIPEDGADPSEGDAGLWELIADIGNPGAGVTVTGAEGGLVLWSAGNDHYPQVRLEQWSGQPPRDQEEWETEQEVSFSMNETGKLALTAISGGKSKDASPVVLPCLGTYRARVHTRGRDEAACHGEAEFYRGVERWLVQIWPES